jgi:hypothetical protein
LANSTPPITLRDFESLAADANLGKPLATARLTEMAERVMDGAYKVAIANPVSEEVADLIPRHAATALHVFRVR